MNLVQMDKKLDILLNEAFHLAWDYYLAKTLNSLENIAKGLESVVSNK